MWRWLSALALLAALLALAIAGRATQVAPAAFSHGKHGGIACLQCHHDWQESRARQRCKGCHLGKPELRGRLEADFHALCRGCHLDPPAAGVRVAAAAEAAASAGSHPPVARCSGCHAGPAAGWQPGGARSDGR